MCEHSQPSEKSAKINGQKAVRFYPDMRILNDGLFRFARGLADMSYPDTPAGDFPNPHQPVIAPDNVASVQTKSAPIPNNVVNLHDYHKRER